MLNIMAVAMEFRTLFILCMTPSVLNFEINQEFIDQIYRNSIFETVIILGKSDLKLNYPQIIRDLDFPELVPLKGASTRLLIILFIENMKNLEEIAFYMNGMYKTKVLINCDFPWKIEDIFEKCRTLNMENVIVIQKEQFFSYQPYSKPVQIFEINSTKLFGINYFKGYGYESLTIADDQFWTEDCFYDFCDLIRTHFGQKFKVNITVLPKKDIENPTLMMNSWKSMKGYKYPQFHEYGRVSVAIPANNVQSKSLFYTFEFGKHIWRCTLLITIFFTIVLSIQSYMKFKKIKFDDNFLIVISINLNNSILKVNNISRFEVYIYSLMLIQSFFLYTIYSSSLGSLFITNEPSSNIHVLLSHRNHYDTMLKTHPEILEHFEIRVIQVPKYYEAVKSLNLNYGYLIATTMWRRELNFQKFLKKFLFCRLREWSSYEYPRSFLIQEKSIFLERLNEANLEVLAVGLMKKWANNMTIRNYAKKLIAMDIAYDSNLASPLTVQDIGFIGVLYGICILISIIAFLIEVCCGTIRSRRKLFKRSNLLFKIVFKGK